VLSSYGSVLLLSFCDQAQVSWPAGDPFHLLLVTITPNARGPSMFFSPPQRSLPCPCFFPNYALLSGLTWSVFNCVRRSADAAFPSPPSNLTTFTSVFLLVRLTRKCFNIGRACRNHLGKVLFSCACNLFFPPSVKGPSPFGLYQHFSVVNFLSTFCSHESMRSQTACEYLAAFFPSISRASLWHPSTLLNRCSLFLALLLAHLKRTTSGGRLPSFYSLSPHLLRDLRDSLTCVSLL